MVLVDFLYTTVIVLIVISVGILIMDSMKQRSYEVAFDNAALAERAKFCKLSDSSMDEMVIKPLLNADINTVYELISLSPTQILNIRGVGEERFRRIHHYIHRYWKVDNLWDSLGWNEYNYLIEGEVYYEGN